MKKTIFLAFAVLIGFNSIAQSPDLFSYQAVVRDNAGAVISSKVVSIKFSILKTTATGTAQFVETHKPTTDANGLISIEIGGGSVTSGSISTIDWATDKYFLKVELDPAGGGSYSNMGTTQLISVPYAKHATTSSRALDNFDKDSTNELQALSKSGDTIFLSNGGFVQVPKNWDNDTTNELQQLSISNDTIYLSNGGFAVIPDSSLLGVPKGGSGIGAGGKADLRDFDNKFNGISKIGEGFSIRSLESDVNKNVYISGWFKGRMTIGSQSFTGPNANKSEVFVAKLDSSFNLLWVKVTSGAEFRRTGFIADDNGNSYLLVASIPGNQALSFDGVSYPLQSSGGGGKIFKLTASGSITWSTDYYVTSNHNSLHLGLTPNSELLITSNYQRWLKIGNDSINFGGYPNKYGLIKVSSNGQSFTLLDSAVNTFGQGVTSDPSGNIYVLLASNYQQSGNVQLNGSSVAIPNGILLIKYSSTGSVLSTNNTFGGYNDIHSSNRIMKHDGTNLYLGFLASDFLIGSTYYNGGRTYLLRFNPTLVIQASTFLESNYAVPFSIAKKSNGEIVMGLEMNRGYVLNDVQYKMLSGDNSWTGMFLQFSTTGTIQKHKMLQLFKQADGMRLDVTGNSVFVGCSILGSFYNKGTKYTAGVYLFKE